MQDADLIVVGGGSAGAALAGRLDPRLKVLLIEAGPKGAWPWTTVPIGYGKTFYHPGVNWMYRSQPVPGFGDRVSYWPRGKVLGGSSTINAMVYSRGQRSDFDHWAQVAGSGWSWDEVLRVYRTLEDHDLGAGPWHGAGGPLHVTDTERNAHPTTLRFIEAAAELGLPFTPDLNGASIEGAGFYQITTRAGRRESAATAFLRRRPTLRVVTGHQAMRLVLDGRRVTGVTCMGPAGEVTFRAPRVVVSGGAVGSPLLLQRSGIGPGALLQAHGIEVQQDSPVGLNLQDHLGYDMIYRATVPTLNQQLGTLAGQALAAMRWGLMRTGPLAASVNQGGAFYRARPGANHPDMQVYFSPLTYERAEPGKRVMTKPDLFPGFCTAISPTKMRSVGRIEIASPDFRAAPLIAPNYLDDPDDMAQMLSGAKWLRALAATQALAPLVAEELKPGASVEGDAALEADIRARAYTIFHPCCTCRMGRDSAANVVGPDLKVFGVEGLYVADASIFPEVTSGNTNAPAMMVGARAAELLSAS